jgi:hypothetical protein
LPGRGRHAPSSTGLIGAIVADHARGSRAKDRLAVSVRAAGEAIASFHLATESCLTGGPEADAVDIALGGALILANTDVLVWPATPFVVRNAYRLAALLLLADAGTTRQIRTVATNANVEAAKGVGLGVVLVPVLSLAAPALLVLALCFTLASEAAAEDPGEGYPQSSATGERSRLPGNDVEYSDGHRFLRECDDGDAWTGYVSMSGGGMPGFCHSLAFTGRQWLVLLFPTRSRWLHSLQQEFLVRGPVSFQQRSDLP